MTQTVVFGFYKCAAAKNYIFTIKKGNSKQTAIYNFIYYGTVDFFIIPCYNISITQHPTIQKRLDFIISRVDIMMHRFVGLLIQMMFRLLIFNHFHIRVTYIYIVMEIL